MGKKITSVPDNQMTKLQSFVLKITRIGTDSACSSLRSLPL